MLEINIAILILIIIIALYLIREEALVTNTINLPPRNITLPDEIDYSPKSLLAYQRNMQHWILRLQNTDEFGPLKEQCHYALDGGKFVRPIIALEIGRIMSSQNGKSNDYSSLALAIEYIHSSSLVIDDMSYFDNDFVRRGKPSVHAKYGQAQAEMTALTLLVSAGQNLARQFQSSEAISSVITFVTFFVNKQIQVTAYGQIQDMTEKTSDVIKNKTSTLFQIATVVSYLLAGGKYENIDDFMELGNCFAFVLQLLDDINDRETDVNYNHVHTNGIDKTFEEIKIFINKSYDLLKKYKLNSPLWREIFEKLLI